MTSAVASTNVRLVREAMGRFASGVTIVTTRTHDGNPAGCAVSAFCSLSLSPPLVLVCIGKDRRMHGPLTAAGGFAVNVLRHDQAELAKRFAEPDPDRFAGVVSTPGYLGVPVLAGAIASVECRRWNARRRWRRRDRDRADRQPRDRRGQTPALLQGLIRASRVPVTPAEHQMPIAVCTMSHSPLMGVNPPAAPVAQAVHAAIDEARAFVADYAPEIVVIFGPDHYNGVFYDLMPPFCVAAAATSVGDHGTADGPLRVDAAAAHIIAAKVLDAGVDVALSERMRVDHGFTQVLEALFGSIAAVPVVPVFINAIAAPLGPVRRIRLLGRAVGTAAMGLGRRVLMVGSGGLSHDPPVPQLAGAPSAVAERLIAGRDPTAAERVGRENLTARLGREFAQGGSAMRPLNPDWDRHVLDLLADNRLAEVDGWQNDWVIAEAGRAGHEVRTWIAAYAALAVAGRYEITSSFYKPIPEWIVGFGVTTARSANSEEQS